jgi:hypothetical protein
MNLKSPLIFVSYKVGRLGGVMAEYAEDKLRTLEYLGLETLVITSLDSIPNDRASVRYFRIPSLSWSEFSKQINSLNTNGQPLPWQGFLMYPFSFSLGRIIDVFFLKKLGSSSGGNWTWAFVCLPITLFLSLRNRAKVVFATGSASAGLVGAFVRVLLRTPFFYEIPDPLVGSTLLRNPAQLKRIVGLENFLIRKSSKTVFNSRRAASDAMIRNPSLEYKISAVYPGAWTFMPDPDVKPRSKFSFVHLGSLYGSRNLDLFFAALEKVVEEDSLEATKFQVINVGHVDEQQINNYSSAIDFVSIPDLNRDEAIRFASSCSTLLLIQHEDSRSAESIPFKIYDYLNLNLPIISVLDNPEILDLLGEYSVLANKIKDIEQLKISIRKSLAWNSDQSAKHRASLDPLIQFQRIFL